MFGNGNSPHKSGLFRMDHYKPGRPLSNLETGALAIELHSSLKRMRRTIEARRGDVMHYTWRYCKTNEQAGAGRYERQW